MLKVGQKCNHNNKPNKMCFFFLWIKLISLKLNQWKTSTLNEWKKKTNINIQQSHKLYIESGKRTYEVEHWDDLIQNSFSYFVVWKPFFFGPVFVFLGRLLSTSRRIKVVPAGLIISILNPLNSSKKKISTITTNLLSIGFQYQRIN